MTLGFHQGWMKPTTMVTGAIRPAISPTSAPEQCKYASSCDSCDIFHKYNELPTELRLRIIYQAIPLLSEWKVTSSKTLLARYTSVPADEAIIIEKKHYLCEIVPLLSTSVTQQQGCILSQKTGFYGEWEEVQIRGCSDCLSSQSLRYGGNSLVCV